MSAPDLDQTTRAALDRALAGEGLTDADRAALTVLRDACPEPRWLPTEDGLAVRVDSDGDRTIYYVRDGKAGAYLCSDGTLRHPYDPVTLAGTWEPYVHEVTPEQINSAAWAGACPTYTIRAVLSHLGCREVNR